VHEMLALGSCSTKELQLLGTLSPAPTRAFYTPLVHFVPCHYFNEKKSGGAPVDNKNRSK